MSITHICAVVSSFLALYDPTGPSIFDETLYPILSRPLPPDYAATIPSVSDVYDFLKSFFQVSASVVGFLRLHMLYWGVVV